MRGVNSMLFALILSAIEVVHSGAHFNLAPGKPTCLDSETSSLTLDMARCFVNETLLVQDNGTAKIRVTRIELDLCKGWTDSINVAMFNKINATGGFDASNRKYVDSCKIAESTRTKKSFDCIDQEVDFLLVDFGGEMGSIRRVTLFSPNESCKDHLAPVSRTLDKEVSRFKRQVPSRKALSFESKFSSFGGKFASIDEEMKSMEDKFPSFDDKFPSFDHEFKSLHDKSSPSWDTKILFRDSKVSSSETKFSSSNTKVSSSNTKVLSSDTKVASSDTKISSWDPKFPSLDPKFPSLDPKFPSLDHMFPSVDVGVQRTSCVRSKSSLTLSGLEGCSNDRSTERLISRPSPFRATKIELERCEGWRGHIEIRMFSKINPNGGFEKENRKCLGFCEQVASIGNWETFRCPEIEMDAYLINFGREFGKIQSVKHSYLSAGCPDYASSNLPASSNDRRISEPPRPFVPEITTLYRGDLGTPVARAPGHGTPKSGRPILAEEATPYRGDLGAPVTSVPGHGTPKTSRPIVPDEATPYRGDLGAPAARVPGHGTHTPGRPIVPDVVKISRNYLGPIMGHAADQIESNQKMLNDAIGKVPTPNARYPSMNLPHLPNFQASHNASTSSSRFHCSSYILIATWLLNRMLKLVT